MQDGILIFKTGAEVARTYFTRDLTKMVAGNGTVTLTFATRELVATGSGLDATVQIDCSDADASADLQIALSKVIQKGTVLVFDEAASDYPVTGITGLTLS